MRMNLSLCVFIVGLLLWSPQVFSVTVEVNKAGTNGAFTSIQAAIDSGADDIKITDSGVYVENLEIGDPNDTVGANSAVTLRSTGTGAERPVIRPSELKEYVDAHTGHRYGFGLFANNSVIKNLIAAI